MAKIGWTHRCLSLYEWPSNWYHIQPNKFWQTVPLSGGTTGTCEAGREHGGVLKVSMSRGKISNWRWYLELGFTPFNTWQEWGPQREKMCRFLFSLHPSCGDISDNSDERELVWYPPPPKKKPGIYYIYPYVQVHGRRRMTHAVQARSPRPSNTVSTVKGGARCKSKTQFVN
jgi:hypothetical protein